MAIDSIDDMRLLFDGIPLGQGVDVDDDQRAGRGAAAALPTGRRGAGRRRRPADRHDPERRAQGVHRPRHLHLSAAAVAAADHRHLRVLPRRRCRGGTRSRSPATTWPRPARRPRRRSPSRSPTASSTSGPRSPPAWTSTTSRRGLSFFFVSRTTLLEEVAKFRAARRIWAQVMRDEFGAKNPKSLMLRFHTQTAGVQLTAQQPEVNLVRVADPGAGGRARRHPVAAHELLRRGDRAADREGGPARAAHPAGARLRDRRDRDRRPVRRLVRRRVADRRGRGGRARADGAGRGPRRRGRRDRAGLPEERDRAVRVPDRPGDRRRRAGRRRRQPLHDRRSRTRTSRCASTRPSRRSRPNGWPGCAPSATHGA